MCVKVLLYKVSTCVCGMGESFTVLNEPWDDGHHLHEALLSHI